MLFCQIQWSIHNYLFFLTFQLHLTNWLLPILKTCFLSFRFLQDMLLPLLEVVNNRQHPYRKLWFSHSKIIIQCLFCLCLKLVFSKCCKVRQRTDQNGPFKVLDIRPWVESTWPMIFNVIKLISFSQSKFFAMLLCYQK